MAIYHCSVKVASRSAGRSSVGMASYRAGEKIEDLRTGEVYDYTRKRTDGSEIIAPDNAPEWAMDRAELWNHVEQAEKRKDAQVCREVEVSLPQELTNPERRELIRAYAKEQFVEKGMVADVSYHNMQGENPHAHIMLTMRDIDENGFGQKNRDWNQKELLGEWREEWQHHANRALEMAGHEQRIDHRNLAAQGIEREPQVHLGPNVAQMEGRGIRTDRGTQALAIDERNEQLERSKELLHERDRSHEASPERGPDGGGDRTASPGPRGPERRAEADLGRTEEHGQRHEQQPGGRQHEAEQLHPGRDHEGRSHRAVVQESPRGPAASRPLVQPPSVGAGPGHEPHDWNGSRDRILALAAPIRANESQSAELGRLSGHSLPDGPGPKATIPAADGLSRTDRTAQAIQHQLKAMGCDRYEIGIRDRETGRMLNKTWTPQELEKNTPWLKRLNAQGNDIYVRPAKDASRQDLVLIDDLKKSDLQRMYAEGIKPALVIETSPRNHQAWVKLPQPANDAERREVARELARTYGGDPQSADARHYGRLGGFTNQKPQYVDELGKRPYCLVRDSTGQVAERGGQQLSQARERVADQVHQVDLSKRVEIIRDAGTRWGGSSPVATYQREAGKLAEKIEKAGEKLDWSRIDYSVTAQMAKSGNFSADQIKNALQVASPNLASRHPGAAADYAARTLQKVIATVPGASQALSLAIQTAKRAMTLER